MLERFRPAGTALTSVALCLPTLRWSSASIWALLSFWAPLQSCYPSAPLSTVCPTALLPPPVSSVILSLSVASHWMKIGADQSTSHVFQVLADFQKWVSRVPREHCSPDWLNYRASICNPSARIIVVCCRFLAYHWRIAQPWVPRWSIWLSVHANSTFQAPLPFRRHFSSWDLQQWLRSPWAVRAAQVSLDLLPLAIPLFHVASSPNFWFPLSWTPNAHVIHAVVALPT